MIPKKSFPKKANRSRPLAYLLCALVLVLTIAACGQDNGKKETTSADNGFYTCGMHPQVLLQEPGNCPICGMKLTPVKSETPVRTETEHASQEHASTTADFADTKKPDAQKKILYWRAPMDPTYITDKPGKSPMGMDLIPVYAGEEPTGGSTISIDPVTVQNMGVRTALVRRQPFSRLIRSVGHIDYNEEKLSTVNLKFSGWIEKLLVSRTGEFVRKGQPLLEVYSPDLVATQEEYLLAFKNQEKLQSSSFAEVSEGARSLLKAARQRLEYWDIREDDIQALERSGAVRKTLTIHAPSAGVVVQKNAIEGAHARAGEELFRIVDLSTVWVYAHIFEYELPWIAVGQRVHMELPYMPGRAFHGTVDYIYPYLDSKTRDVKIRLVFENPRLELKPQMYANIGIEAKAGDQEIVIPTEAIIRSGTRNLVFLDLGDGRFGPQEVVVGPEGEEGLIKIIGGLTEGQRIVTSAQFLLDSESRLQEAIQKMLESRRSGSQR